MTLSTPNIRTPNQQTPDRPFIGILFVLGFCVFAPISDAAAKALTATTPLLILLLARYISQWILPLPVIFLTRRRIGMSPRVLWIITIRSVIHMGGIAAMFVALRYLPLADTLAIAFVFPFIMLLLGKFFLGEQVGIRRLSACTVGFIGTLLVIQPSFAVVGLPALLPLLVALLFSILVLLTRQIAKDYDPVCLQSMSGFISCVLLFVGWIVLGNSGLYALEMVMPEPHQFMTLFYLGFFGTIAHIAMTYAVRFAPSTTVAPVQYVEIPIATLVGWMVFGDLPNGMASVGITVTIAAGLAVIFFEHRAARRLAS